MHERRRFEVVIEAMSPIAHASESIGNSSLVMREKRRLPDGTFAHVPVVTGDTMRHGLREAAAYALLDAAGLLENPSLGEAALRLLFAGGMITGEGGGSVRLADFNRMIELCPHLGLLGGCAQNRAIPGKVQVDAADLICRETMHRLPEWVAAWLHDAGISVNSCRAHIEEVQRVRMDPTLDPSKRKLMTSSVAASVEERLAESERGAEAGDAAARENNKSSMLPRRHETVVAGSLFFWSVSATLHSELEASTFESMVGDFLRDARVGGKRATGHGRIRAVTARRCRRDGTTQEVAEAVDLADFADQPAARFREHVRERAADVEAWLTAVNA